MQLTPFQAYEHIKESLVQYIETAYRISNRELFEERGNLLRETGVVAQEPFVEATPAFPTSRKLSVLERSFAFLPDDLSELVRHGVPIDLFDLYTHQEQALLAAFSEQPNLLVATGTGSGKTEAFLLPILADLLNEARNWSGPKGSEQPGHYDGVNDVWLHSRRHETRPAGIRAIVLYPMNALVNDQLSRLRRMLSLGESPNWQRRNLGGNVIRFGMYTSLAKPTRTWREKRKRDEFDRYIEGLSEDWEGLSEDLRKTGFWPRPNSPEMLCRWDMQMAPPDILVTNYSMLEYMLVRPIEKGMFDATREWLNGNDEARMTLVLDEAHTYAGARGTEVAHLVRRLKERLGLSAGSGKFRAIATTASLPDYQGAGDQLLQFISELLDEPGDQFTLIQLPRETTDLPEREPAPNALEAFEKFHNSFQPEKPEPAIEELAMSLGAGPVDRTVEPQIALHRILESNPDVQWVRQRTARNATLLGELSEDVWGNLGDVQKRERATAGILAAGSYARPVQGTDVPPLISMRLHLFFRGIPGLWACMDPKCSEVESAYRGADRPLGKLFDTPTYRCGCGSRVLELFSCRRCGLLFLGGIPDNVHGSLWPWSDDLTGGRQDLKQYTVFGVEPAHQTSSPQHRSTRTTLLSSEEDRFSREVYEIEPTIEGDAVISPFPQKCPRCESYRQPGPDGREIIEPLRTKGPESFSLIVEDGFRIQPRARKSNPPNHGRKALLFSDSRMEAAKLAGDIRHNHARDTFRQLLLLALQTCPKCDGRGKLEEYGDYVIGQEHEVRIVDCTRCDGRGYVEDPPPLEFEDLRRRVIELQLERGINPGQDRVSDFFARLEAGDPGVRKEAEMEFNLALRRELAEDEFSLEPLGLASWRVALPPGDFGAFEPLTPEETRVFLRSVARILSTENILLPPHPYDPWEWPDDRLRPFERQVIVTGYQRREGWQGQAIPYNLEYRKLGRYVQALAQSLLEDGRLSSNEDVDSWLRGLYWPLWKTMNAPQVSILQWGGAKYGNQVPKGIRIDSFSLHPIGGQIYQCQSCAYVMSETVADVCIRCGHRTTEVEASSYRNYYRRQARLASQNTPYDDPYPLRAIEHTAQIPGAEARDIERWFQDLFREGQDPRDYRVDVLSVTTTMEMGIDIGSLLCVGLRNVPPSVANYQQRAGRAGRRGSSIATVITYAQDRSHDQYYFAGPPEIVSDPPRIPPLHVANEVIARRHARALVLQEFFGRHKAAAGGSSLFSSWGPVGEFINEQLTTKLRTFLASNMEPLTDRCRQIVHAELHGSIKDWILEIPEELQRMVIGSNLDDGVLERAIDDGLLPGYAFPTNVVRLRIPELGGTLHDEYQSSFDSMQRDLKIALSEYAPGSEVIRGEFPETYIFRSAGLYDPFDYSPNYQPDGLSIECRDCQAIHLVSSDGEVPDVCSECGNPSLEVMPYITPPGFTVDHALPSAGAERYQGGGRETSGYVAPARLLVGRTSFEGGRREAFANGLYTDVRVGDLFISNKGPNSRFPGFLICPTCGRSLDPEDPGPHTYPVDIPPHYGAERGPRAGSACPNIGDFSNQVLLGHEFHSEVVLLGVDLPLELDAPFWAPAGRAVWYSFGTLIANSAAIVLQIDPGEVRVGVRPVNRGLNRLHGETFIYDDVPGGAGYARAIRENIKEILGKALELANDCPNPDCESACYQCLFDYGNQYLHPILDRRLGAATLEYVLYGTIPSIDNAEADRVSQGLKDLARDTWQIVEGQTTPGAYLPVFLEAADQERIGLWVKHPLQASPSTNARNTVSAVAGARVAVHNSFDLERRPFWVLNNLLT